MIATVAAVLGTWTAAAIPAGCLIGRRLRHLEDPMPDQTTPGTVPPEIVSAALRDPHSPLYPSQIGVYCDECGTTTEADYLVSTEQTKAERLDVARQHLRRQGWICDERGDYCPMCAYPSRAAVLAEVAAERARQDNRWGEQNHPDGTGEPGSDSIAAAAQLLCQGAAVSGHLDWLHILREEVAEAFAESDPARLRAELVQVAAVATAWIEAIDRRAAASTAEPTDVVAYRTPDDVLTCIPCGKDIPGAVELADDDLPNGGLCRICDADVYCAAEAIDRRTAASTAEPVDFCRVVDVGGEPIRVQGAGEMSDASRAALAEVIGAAKRRYAAEHPDGEPVISPRVAAHVLWQEGLGGHPAGSFTTALLKAWWLADPANSGRLAAAWPEYGAAITLLTQPGGADRLRTLAGEQPAPDRP